MLNKVMLIGRLGQNAEFKYMPSGSPMTTFSVATTEKWKDKGGERQERTTWHRVVLWGKVAETLAPMLDKGKLVYVEGRIDQRQYQAKDGTTRYTTEVVAGTIKLMDRRPGGAIAREPEPDFGQAHAQDFGPSRTVESIHDQEPNETWPDNGAPAWDGDGE